MEFEQRPEHGKEINPEVLMEIQWKNILGRRNSKCKSPKKGTWLVRLINSNTLKLFTE